MGGRVKGQRNASRKRIVTVHGYVDVFEPTHPLAKKNGYVREHRMVAWDAGILTDKTKNVHHRNEKKTDNRIQNLEVIGHAEHVRQHWDGKKRGAWSAKRRKEKSIAMKGNKNWRGNEHPHLLADEGGPR